MSRKTYYYDDVASREILDYMASEIKRIYPDTVEEILMLEVREHFKSFIIDNRNSYPPLFVKSIEAIVWGRRFCIRVNTFKKMYVLYIKKKKPDNLKKKITSVIENLRTDRLVIDEIVFSAIIKTKVEDII